MVISKMLSLLVLAYAVAGATCPGYTEYSQGRHSPLSLGPLHLSSARPLLGCRKFNSSTVEATVKGISGSLKDPDVARLFENCYPNTLDTAVTWYTLGDDETKKYVLSGTVNVFWLRESAQKLRPYRDHIAEDESIAGLFKEVIKSQIEYILDINPVCNTFKSSKKTQTTHDTDLSSSTTQYSDSENAIPIFGPRNSVFECKYALDSLASFFQVSADYFEASQDPLFFADSQWLNATKIILTLVKNEARSPFSHESDLLTGSGSSPVTSSNSNDTKVDDEVISEKTTKQKGNGLLVKSFFRPSNEAQVFQYNIPANAYMSAEMSRAADIAASIIGGKETTGQMINIARSIKTGVEENAIVHNPKFGRVYAYEIDGYGGQAIMDDANYPNLLGLPLMNFTDVANDVYQNTRKMVLSRQGNPYYFVGKETKGVGSSRTGLERTWPVSFLIAIQTSKDASEIVSMLATVGNSTSGLGLMHESVYVDDTSVFTQSWYSQANGLFGSTIIDIIQRFPGLIDNGRSITHTAKDHSTTDTLNSRNVTNPVSGALP